MGRERGAWGGPEAEGELERERGAKSRMMEVGSGRRMMEVGSGRSWIVVKTCGRSRMEYCQ